MGEPPGLEMMYKILITGLSSSRAISHLHFVLHFPVPSNVFGEPLIFSGAQKLINRTEPNWNTLIDLRQLELE